MKRALMRINVYSQELTNEVELIEKNGTDDNGEPAVFTGVRLFLLSPDQLHHTDDDDDRSAITIWLPKSESRRKELSRTLQHLGDMVLEAAP
jgi:hypothetical protein